MGITPFAASLERSPDTAMFEFRLRGHEPVRQSIPLANDSEVTVTLVAASPPPQDTTPVESKLPSATTRGPSNDATDKSKRKGKKPVRKKRPKIDKDGIKEGLF